MSPVLSFILTLSKSNKKLRKISSIEWTCYYNCNLEKLYFPTSSPFTSAFNQVLVNSLKENKLKKRIKQNLDDRPFKQPNKHITWEYLLSRPVLNLFIENLHTLTDAERKYCNWKKNSRHHLTIPVGSEDECLEAKAYILGLVADHLNFSIVFGNFIQHKWNPFYFQGVIFAFSWNAAFSSDTSYEACQMRQTGNRVALMGYCELDVGSKKWDVVKILTNPFDKETWIGICKVSCSILLFFLIENYYEQNKYKVIELVLEVVSILMQQGAFKRTMIRILVVTGLFVLSFIYCSVMTENMIVPRHPYIRETLTELLQLGYKVQRDLKPFKFITRGLVNLTDIKHIANYMEPYLKEESFSGNISSEKYWKKQLDAEDFYSIQQYKQVIWSPEAMKSTIYIKTGSSQQRFRTKAKFRTKMQVKSNGTLECNFVKKSYTFDKDTILVYSIARQRLDSVISKLFMESGIRDFWNKNMENRYKIEDSIYKQNHSKTFMHSLVAKLKIDERLIGVLTMTGIAIAPSILIFFVEMIYFSKNKPRCLLKTQKIWVKRKKCFHNNFQFLVKIKHLYKHVKPCKHSCKKKTCIKC